MRTRDRFMPEDFTTAREDGRYESDVAWARDMLMNMRPAYSLDMVTCAGDFPGWRAGLFTPQNPTSASWQN